MTARTNDVLVERIDELALTQEKKTTDGNGDSEDKDAPLTLSKPASQVSWRYTPTVALIVDVSVGFAFGTILDGREGAFFI